MLKINKSILIICLVSLFLIIGQISASDTDLMETSDTGMNDLRINQNTNEISDDSNMNHPESNTVEKIDDEIVNENVDEIIEEEEKDTNGVVMANDNYSCGPASLATVLNKNGLNLSLNEVSKQTNTSLNGTTMQSLIDAAKYYGFSAYGVEIDTKSLKENHIIHLNINGCEHWTVINKLTDTHVFLADSTEGNMNFTIDEFNSYFSKKAIVLSRNDSIDLKEELIARQINILSNDQCMKVSGKGLKKKIVGYRIVWKYGLIQKYGWVLRPKVVGGHVSFSQWVYVKGNRAVWGKYKVKQPIYKYYYVSDDALTSAKIRR
ncbi:cysteine peptidase family C39 domain-containing protein [uncultured Methanobrevibacter sp.]|uniref:cysteine peptidase family C39 domain-containing protein n=1 Tax=uncultured Methanobrevibacter sp. TaxID=253161 RepID=UPI0025FE4F52|nr:cysteine peptidase family C39 domain-containing protein [uncultured Methanobrevibacter sp.]